MTSVKCMCCQQYWTIGTKNPDWFPLTSQICPLCIPKKLPVLGGKP